MKKLAQLEKTIPLIGNMFLPAFLFAVALLSFYLCGDYSSGTTGFLHIGFYLLNFGGFLALLYFNRAKPVFLLLIMVISYTLINLFKHQSPETYISSAAYISLCSLVPINLLFFYFWPRRPLFAKINVWFLLGIFAQYALAEHLARSNIGLGFFLFSAPSSLNIFAVGMFLIVLGIILVNAIRSGSITDYNFFFSFLALMLSFYYSDTASGLSVFSFCAVLCLLSALAQNLYNETYKDTLTGLDSRNSYMIHAKNFPLKYSIGIVSIDDYDKLGTNFGRRIRNILTKLIAEKIIELEKDEAIYRYADDEFVIVYKSLDKKEGFERLEIIRRAIASAQFQFSPRKKPIKLTVSASISEKKRSDANSFEVLVRADKALQKTRAFSHNVTSKA